jgi:lipopolysaccharide export system protein LptA
LVTADRAEINPAHKQCTLSGNVVIKQIKKTDNDTPLVTKGQELLVDLVSGKLTVQGTAAQPVTTVINLSNTTFKPSKTA